MLELIIALFIIVGLVATFDSPPPSDSEDKIC